MHYTAVFKPLGLILGLLACFLLLPSGLALWLNTEDQTAFFYAFGISAALSAGFSSMPSPKHAFSYREGFFVVSLAWVLVALVGSVPFYLQGISFTDAFFESMSGFTTTGATIFADVEQLSKPLLLWRSLSQWMGGMGIIVLVIAVLPHFEISGIGVYQAEVPSPITEKLTPRIQNTAKTLWGLYCAFTVIVLVAMLWLGLDFFDAINHALTTAASGGFSTKNQSIASFQNPGLEWFIIVCMLLVSINFGLHYNFLRQGFKLKYYNNSELKFFIGLLLIAVVLISLSVGVIEGQSLRGVLFTIMSLLTTTGYTTVNYGLWPLFVQFMLLLLMVVGGCAGSTSGGVKALRVFLIFKYSYVTLLRLIHPNLVRQVKLHSTTVSMQVLTGIIVYAFLYAHILILSTALVLIETADLTTALSSVIASLSNVGPALAGVGPTETYANLGALSKWVLAADMLVGRLEILTLVVLFLPNFWQR